MKLVHIHTEVTDVLQRTLRAVIGQLLGDSVAFTDNIDEAHIVLLRSVRTLEQHYKDESKFILLNFGGQPVTVAANVSVATTQQTLVPILKAITEFGNEHRPLVQPLSGQKNRMSILVVDDKAVHREAAIAQFAGSYLITIATTYAQALQQVRTGSYDAVLTDLMLPASVETLGQDAVEQFAGQEMPLGFVIALLAAFNGAKYVGVVTDMNHHSHPMSAALDHLRMQFTVQDARLVFCNSGAGGGKDWQSVLNALLNS